MKVSTAVLLALCAVVAYGRAATEPLSSNGSLSVGCSASYDGDFQISIIGADGHANEGKSVFKKRTDCYTNGELTVNLKASVLQDSGGRTGYVSESYQLQFDDPPQVGALITAGFSVCENGTLALSSNTVFYQCQSGAFYNIYDRMPAPQCSPIYIKVVPCGDDEAGENKTVDAEKLPTATVPLRKTGSSVATIKTQAPLAICQIEDGQIQAHTTPCTDVVPLPVETCAARTVTETVLHTIEVCTADKHKASSSIVPTSDSKKKEDAFGTAVLAAAGAVYLACIVQ